MKSAVSNTLYRGIDATNVNIGDTRGLTQLHHENIGIWGDGGRADNDYSKAEARSRFVFFLSG